MITVLMLSIQIDKFIREVHKQVSYSLQTSNIYTHQPHTSSFIYLFIYVNKYACTGALTQIWYFVVGRQR
jgi:hypothetical protein